MRSEHMRLVEQRVLSVVALLFYVVKMPNCNNKKKRRQKMTD